jgi:hypothetical protein
MTPPASKQRRDNFKGSFVDVEVGLGKSGSAHLLFPKK